MRILDRYIITSFLKNYLISFMVLVGLYVVLDMVFNFDDLTRGAGLVGGAEGAGAGGSALFVAVRMIADIAGFYFYQMFVFFVHLSGIIPVVAAAFTLMRFTRFNELTAMLAAGTPLLRIAMPIIVVALILNGLLIIDQELIIPRLIPKIIRQHSEIRDNRTSFAIRALQDSQNNLLVAGLYHPGTEQAIPSMEQVDLILRDASLQPLAHVSADSATWDGRAKLWRLENGRRTTGLLPDERPRIEPVQTIVTASPTEIALYASHDVVELLSTRQINALADRSSYGRLDLLRVKHWRFTQPLANVVLLLLAIPCVLTREPGALKMAAVKTVALTGACLAAMFLAHQLAGSPPQSGNWPELWPALMAWLPIMIFGPLALWLLDRVKS